MIDFVGFMGNTISEATEQYGVNVAISHWCRWDRQTITMMCEDMDMINDIRGKINKVKKPNSTYNGTHHIIDGFVNLVYDPKEVDPANRNVRIVYCDMSHMREIDVYERFRGSYIINIGRSVYYAKYESRQTSRGIFEIPSKQRYVREIPR